MAEEFGGAPEWIEIRTPKNSALSAALEMTLHRGEATAIALAVESDPTVIVLDDRKARAAAGHMNLAVIGTVGLILRAKKIGLIQAARPVFDELDAAGFRLSRPLRAKALAIAGEVLEDGDVV